MKVWAGFWALGVIWGSSFLLIKVGVEEMTPLQLVAVRVGVAAVAMLLTMHFLGLRFPKDRASRLGLVIVGLFNTAIPFVLITWGETSIDSGLATVLNSTMPLFSLVIAHFALQDERITGAKVLGLLSGFMGIVVLTSRAQGTTAVPGNIAGQLAVLGAAVCYAGTTVFVRRNLRHLQSIVVSSGALLSAAVVVVVLAILIDGVPSFAQYAALTNVSIVILGLLNTYVAYLLYYWIIAEWGATRATLVTYVMPPVGLGLGVIFLGELLDARLLFGAVLIGLGVFLVNLKGLRFDRVLARLHVK